MSSAQFVEDVRRAVLAGKPALCSSCKPLGRCALGIDTIQPRGEGRLLATLKCPSTDAGGPGIAHGGWIGWAFDEILSHLGVHLGVFTVTGRLGVEYLKPTPVERDLEINGWIVKRENGRYEAAGELTLAGNPQVLARATGMFVERDVNHFDRHKAWLAAQDAGGDRKGP